MLSSNGSVIEVSHFIRVTSCAHVIQKYHTYHAYESNYDLSCMHLALWFMCKYSASKLTSEMLPLNVIGQLFRQRC